MGLPIRVAARLDIKDIRDETPSDRDRARVLPLLLSFTPAALAGCSVAASVASWSSDGSSISRRLSLQWLLGPSLPVATYARAAREPVEVDSFGGFRCMALSDRFGFFARYRTTAIMTMVISTRAPNPAATPAKSYHLVLKPGITSTTIQIVDDTRRIYYRYIIHAMLIIAGYMIHTMLTIPGT